MKKKNFKKEQLFVKHVKNNLKQQLSETYNLH
jgi:hypothetical protein